MKRLLALIPILVPLAGCGSWPDTSTPQGQCEAAANDDPAVKDIYMRMLGGNNEAQRGQQLDLQDARKTATMQCLRQRGLAPLGGVAPVQRVE
jgi:hypothetical protein